MEHGIWHFYPWEHPVLGMEDGTVVEGGDSGVNLSQNYHFVLLLRNYCYLCKFGIETANFTQ